MNVRFVIVMDVFSVVEIILIKLYKLAWRFHGNEFKIPFVTMFRTYITYVMEMFFLRKLRYVCMYVVSTVDIIDVSLTFWLGIVY